ncbi:hypothetical protein AYO20_01850 [Fonsecaea nubica]|uniref:FHA domain-containing protein n=1 Tax=Fonsecaea nubica TaxID=856822 RepID=A0A178DBG2_9EURO|nr:hypothetical protein AYO20_01850 [Fonsecaea nubica]OAL38644.1 hypothetical protein AYO20_01850 [Fonsecaea nubica]
MTRGTGVIIGGEIMTAKDGNTAKMRGNEVLGAAIELAGDHQARMDRGKENMMIADAFHTTKDGAPTPTIEKQKPNFRPSGLLAAASNTISTSAGAIVLKYHEPPEARKPPSTQPWRLYIFKGESIVDTLDLYTQSCWLFGRETSVCDFALEHPSCSKQHAVIQFRYVERRNEFGDKIGKVKPYVIDLESANGTTVNDEAVPEGRFVELRDKDIIKFGHSTREYVMQMPSG